MVREYNDKAEDVRQKDGVPTKRLLEAYIFGISPFGLVRNNLLILNYKVW